MKTYLRALRGSDNKSDLGCAYESGTLRATENGFGCDNADSVSLCGGENGVEFGEYELSGST